MSFAAITFVILGWIVLFVVFVASAVSAVQYYRAGDFVRAFVCGVACALAAIPMLAVGF